MKQQPIVIVFDDLYPGGLFTLNRRLWRAYKKRYKGNIIVIAGIGFDQHLYTDTFSFADTHYTYQVPRINQVCIFFLVFFHTLKLLGNTPKEAMIVVNNAFSGLAAALFCLITHRKCVYFYHGSLHKEMESLGHPTTTMVLKIRRFAMSLFYWTIQRLTLLISEPVCFSPYAQSLIKKHFGVTANTEVLPVPFSYMPATLQDKSDARRSLGFAEKSRIILFPSRIEPRKGLHILIQAINLLHDKNLLLVVTGPLHGESVEYLTSLTQYDSFHAHKRIYLTGEVNPNGMHLYYKAADVTIVPSIRLEMLGLVTLESLSYGTPVIGFPSGHTPNILESINKKLVAKQIDPQSLARTIRSFFKFSRTQKTAIEKQTERYFDTHHSQEESLKELQRILS
ncbi:MAG: Glycosyl transferase group 1 [Microgenomates group bacterium GW2011_GWB1_40_9]|nr:MAG: Glycosyl transferase group 1 [Microgenomates group bacterium GW2011_GWC1_39_12]KKR79575.1 MAG: Glycosyl transferase group 1 [Microgenomates group bacterium GW2011_GWB1_40_9]